MEVSYRRFSVCANASDSLVSRKVVFESDAEREEGSGIREPGHCGSLRADPYSAGCEPACRGAMAGFIPGLQPTNHSQEKEFAQAYEDVLERYKGKGGRKKERSAAKCTEPK